MSKGNLSTAVKEGLNNKDFIKLVVWLCGELSALYELDVHAVVEHDDLESFLFELSSLLNELGLLKLFRYSYSLKNHQHMESIELILPF